MQTLLRVHEVAELLGLSVSTVRAWLRRGKLPRVSCGRAVRVPAAAVREFIEVNTIPILAADQQTPKPGSQGTGAVN
jgi:excisionase family DNA binding protein